MDFIPYVQTVSDQFLEPAPNSTIFWKRIRIRPGFQVNCDGSKEVDLNVSFGTSTPHILSNGHCDKYQVKRELMRKKGGE